jgi:hypothetical protein
LAAKVSSFGVGEDERRSVGAAARQVQLGEVRLDRPEERLDFVVESL